MQSKYKYIVYSSKGIKSLFINLPIVVKVHFFMYLLILFIVYLKHDNVSIVTYKATQLNTSNP